MNELTPENLQTALLVISALIALVLERFPALSTAYADLTPPQKQLIPLLGVALLALIYYLGTCGGGCSFGDAIELFLSALVVNQGVHMGTKSIGK